MFRMLDGAHGHPLLILTLFTFTSPFIRLILSLCVCVCLSHCRSMHVAVRDNSLEQVYSVHLVKPRDPALIVKPVWSTSTH